MFSLSPVSEHRQRFPTGKARKVAIMLALSTLLNLTLQLALSSIQQQYS